MLSRCLAFVECWPCGGSCAVVDPSTGKEWPGQASGSVQLERKDAGHSVLSERLVHVE